MHLAQLGAENFRVFERLSLRPHRRLNLVYGDNAAGKTTLLEMIYCLGRGKSFRGSSLQDCAGPAGRQWRVKGRFEVPEVPVQVLLAAWDSGGLKLQRNAQEVGRLELVREYPVQILEPGMHKLLQDGPGYRRGFLDWGVFHVEHRFHPAWRRFSRALRQRNLALRQKVSGAEIQPWSVELAAAGEEIQHYRQAQIDAVRERLGALILHLLGTDDWTVELHPGWSLQDGLLETLNQRLPRDRQLGMTQDGPQRAELRLRLHQRHAKASISRGQQKQMIAALLISQCELIHQQSGRAPLLLVDDFAAELGEEYQQRLLGVLQAYPGQVFISSFERSGPLRQVRDCAVFHVEHASVTEC